MIDHGPYRSAVIAPGCRGPTAVEFDALVVERQGLDLGSAQVDSDAHAVIGND